MSNVPCNTLFEPAALPVFSEVVVDKIENAIEQHIQENLTTEIARSVMDITGAAGVGVIIEAKHMCMMMRGVEKQNSKMRTSVMLGTFREDAKTRNEFLQLLKS